MSATFPANFIVLDLRNVTTEKNYSEPKKNKSVLHTFNTVVLVLKQFLDAFIQLRKATIFFVKSARLSFRPRGKLIIFYMGRGRVITEICRENSSFLKI
jgi:hypothetical protein